MSHEKAVIGKVPVLVSRPAVNEPAPLVLLSHWFSGSKEGRIERLDELNEKGWFAVIVHPGVGHECTPEMWANAVAWLDTYL